MSAIHERPDLKKTSYIYDMEKNDMLAHQGEAGGGRSFSVRFGMFHILSIKTSGYLQPFPCLFWLCT